MGEPRVIAGLSCTDVLGVLPDYLDNAVEPARQEKVMEHLEGCDWCERFGGEYAATVRSIRRNLGDFGKRKPEISRQFRRRLAEELDP